MSLWRRKSVSIVIGGDAVGIAAGRERLHSTSGGSVVIELPKMTQSMHLESTMGAIELALKSIGARDAQWDVYVDNHLLKTCVVQPTDLINSIDHRRSLGAAKLISMHGLQEAMWDIAIDDRAPLGSAAIACGIEKELKVSIEEMAGRYASRVASIRPIFADVLNKWVKPSASLDRLVVLLSRPLSMSFSMRSGAWCRSSSFRVEDELTLDDLRFIGEREALLHGCENAERSCIVINPKILANDVLLPHDGEVGSTVPAYPDGTSSLKFPLNLIGCFSR